MQQIEMHYTPKGASWLNMAEIQLSALAKQCLKRRIPTMTALAHEVMTGVRLRNQNPGPICWQFTPDMARQKFQRFYPKLSQLP